MITNLKIHWVQNLIFIATLLSNSNLYSTQNHPTIPGMRNPHLQSFITDYYLMDSSQQMMKERRIRGPISGGFLHKTVTYPDMPLQAISLRKQKAHSKLIQIGNKSIVEKNTSIGYNTTIFENIHIHSNVIIGNNVQVHQNVIIGENVKIGNNVCIGVGVYIAPNTVIGNDTVIQNHAQLNLTKKSHPFPIKIGKYCFIGCDSDLLNGVTAEDHVVINKNCLVIGPFTSIGQRSYLGAESSIEKSSIGKDNKIEADSCLYRSTSEDRVQIGAGSEIGPNVTIEENSPIPRRFIFRDPTGNARLKAELLYSEPQSSDHYFSDIINIEIEDEDGTKVQLQGRIKNIDSHGHEHLIEIVEPEEVYQNAFEIEAQKTPRWNYEPKINSDTVGQHLADRTGECSICLNHFTEDEQLFSLHACSHSFHKSCILPWFTEHQTCPLCRSSSYPNLKDKAKIVEDIKKALLILNHEITSHEEDVMTPTNGIVQFHRVSEDDDGIFFSFALNLHDNRENNAVILAAINHFAEEGLEPDQDYDIEVIYSN
ncbi:MAG: RING finger domain-containing protein [Oligoflexales bacterium]